MSSFLRGETTLWTVCRVTFKVHINIYPAPILYRTVAVIPPPDESDQANTKDSHWVAQ